MSRSTLHAIKSVIVNPCHGFRSTSLMSRHYKLVPIVTLSSSQSVHIVWTAGNAKERGKVSLTRCCQRRLADRRASIRMVDKAPRRCSLEGCHTMSAAMHLIYRLESMEG